MMLGVTALTACGKDDGDGAEGPNQIVWNASKTIHPDMEGATSYTISGKTGAAWTAEIISGNWVSFNNTAAGNLLTKSGMVGTSHASKTLFVYYWPNRGDEERHAVIRFTFEGMPSEDMELIQYSPQGEKDVYQTGRVNYWPEIPAQLEQSTGTINVNDLVYVTHTASLTNLTTGKPVVARNYTMCFDKSKYGSWWVAYPLHASYTGSGRVETWAYDPKIEARFQPNLSKGYPLRGDAPNGNQYDRGHQIPNADRSANATMQAQTFYYSNMTAQNWQLNQQPWGQLESKARDSWMCSDTLYVVTGAVWRNGVTTPDISGKACPVPDYYFKVFVRTVKGNVRTVGDKLNEHELKSIGFWVANNRGQGTATNWVKSVKDIETETGFTFFPSVPDDVKSQKDARSWGL